MNTVSIICYIVSAYFLGMSTGCFIAVGTGFVLAAVFMAEDKEDRQ